jgi:hypothetical protein
MEEQVNFNSAITTAVEQIAKGSHASDVQLLELINAVITRVLTLEEQVAMLMELHRVGEDK